MSSASNATVTDQPSPTSLSTPTSPAATPRSFLPVTIPSVDRSSDRDTSIPHSPRCASAPLKFASPPSSTQSTPVTRPPTYHTNAPTHSVPHYTTASIQTTHTEVEHLQRDESVQSFQSWLLLFPEHTIPFVFRELLH